MGRKGKRKMTDKEKMAEFQGKLVDLMQEYDTHLVDVGYGYTEWCFEFKNPTATRDSDEARIFISTL